MSTFSELRQRADLSVQEAADHVECAISTAYRWEHGEVDTPADAVMMLERISGRTRRKASGFRFIDLFAGIGGIRLAFEEIGGQCVFTSEWNKYSQATYRANFHDGPGHVFAGDITEVDAADIPAHDVLLAGFPCQPFSIAGVSKKNSLGRKHGFQCATQGTLFFDVARIIAHHRPPVFLLENVKNLISHDKGRTFQVIMHTLEEELRYDVSWRVIDAKALIPQHRERIFIVGVRGDLESPLELSTLKLPAAEMGPKLHTILHPEDGSEPADPSFLDGDGKVLAKYTLSDKLWKYLQDYAEKHRRKGNGFGFGLVGPGDVARTLSARYYKDGSEILVSCGKGRNPRRLTPRECARLMGFEKPGRADFVIPVSDTQAYKQFGNAVVVPVVEAVARHMAPTIRAVAAGSEGDVAIAAE